MSRPVVVVTGGASGIGLSVVTHLGDDGWIPISVDLREGGDVARFGGTSLSVDVSDLSACEAAVQTIRDRYGRIDGLVNAAGISRDGVTWKLPPEDFDAVIGVNLRGVWNMTRSVIPSLREREAGSIVNISSINALKGKFGTGAYAASKAAVLALTRVWATELGAFGIRVNAVAPGWIETPLMSDYDESIKVKAREQSALGRLGRPEEVARVITFLMSQSASLVTGSMVTADGGQML